MKSFAIAVGFCIALCAGRASASPIDAPSAAVRDEAKPMGPIAVDVRVAAPAAPGVPLSVTVTARAEALDGLDLEVHADPAALVIAARSAPIDRAGERSWTVTVVPVAAAGATLSVVVTGDIDGVPQAQSAVVSIKPAGASPTVRALSGTPVEAGGEKLSLLPVEERF